MMRARTRWLVTAVALVTAWLLLAPSQLGGPVTYVTTYGISMEPGIHSGDLVIARPQPSYQVGDSVAYPSGSLGITVLHRIVDGGPNGYVTKGDNNTWLDPDYPTADQIYGAQWNYIPQGGVWLSRLTSPVVVVGLLMILLWFGSATPAVRRRRGRERRAAMGTAP